jgi:hypothetical protein
LWLFVIAVAMKSFIVIKSDKLLASRCKIALPRMEKPAFDTKTLSSHLLSFFYITPCRKSLPLPERRTFTFPHAGKVWSLARDRERRDMGEGGDKN